MDLPRPKTYNELMTYRRCREFEMHTGKLAETLFAQIYSFIREDPAHKVVAEGGSILFENAGEEVGRFPVTPNSGYSRLTLTAADFRWAVPASRSAGSYSSGGSSGNNNNNNNNNNNS